MHFSHISCRFHVDLPTHVHHHEQSLSAIYMYVCVCVCVCVCEEHFFYIFSLFTDVQNIFCIRFKEYIFTTGPAIIQVFSRRPLTVEDVVLVH